MTVFALVDCNNFYASCEKLFRPDLKNTPVIVLSNNDGCVVARSKEAKLLGIKMGVPAFKIKDEIILHGIKTFSSNYALYADLSCRVMRILEDVAPAVEIYSIDEAFLDLTGIDAATSFYDYGIKIKETVNRCTGISVGVGIAPTKTLAKLANYAAKKYTATNGVVDLTDKNRQRKLMQITPVEEVWGVGRKTAEKLRTLGINSALDLANSSSNHIRKQFSVVLERTLRELNGESCIVLEEIPPTKKQIVCSRSFGSKVTNISDMREAVATHTSRAAEKLRKEQQKAKLLTVFIQTSRFGQGKQYSNALSAEILQPTSDSRELTRLSQQILKKIWKDGYLYAKAGVMLSDFYGEQFYQADLFDSNSNDDSKEQLMSVVDNINRSRYGKVFFAGQGIRKNWAMKRQNLSPAYTTKWSDLPIVK